MITDKDLQEQHGGLWYLDDKAIYRHWSFRAGLDFAGLWQLCKQLEPPEDTLIVELGTMIGDGAAIMSAALPNHRIITVDSGPSDHARWLADRRLSQWPNVRTWRMTSIEAAAKVIEEDLPVFAAYIDADHSEECVSADIEAWRKAIIPGGWICGHDYDGELWPGTVAAVNKAFGAPLRVFCDSSWVGWQKPA